MRHFVSFAIVAITLIAVSSARAAVVTFSSVNSINGTSSGAEVDNTDTYQFGWTGYYAANHSDDGVTTPADVTVNGRTFYKDPAQVTPSGITLSVSGSGIFSEDARVAHPLNPTRYNGTMREMMDIGTITPVNGSFTLTISGLTVSQPYIVEFLSSDSGSDSRTLSISANGGANTTGVFNSGSFTDPDGGKYVFANFTADASTQNFLVAGSGGRAVLNGVLVMTPVPEPASLATLALGSLLLIRRRHA